MSVLYQPPIVVSVIAMGVVFGCFLNVISFENDILDYDSQLLCPRQQSEEFICSICTSFMEPTQIRVTPCKHTFCASCIVDWLQLSNRPRCPNCRSDVSSVSATVPTDFTARLELIQAFCPYRGTSIDSPDACQWEGSVRSLKDHTKECPFAPVPCPNDCSLSPADETSSRSNAQCRRPVYSPAELPGHLKICPLEPVKCPNSCSAFSIAREHLSEHLNSSCPRRMMKCGLCNQELIVSNLRQHLEDSVDVHLRPSSSFPDDLHLRPHVELLRIAVSIGDAEVVRTLLHFYMNERSGMVLRASIEGASLLISSIKGGHLEVAKLLLEANSSDEHLLLTDQHQQSALSLALTSGHKALVELLLELNSSAKHLLTVRCSSLASAPLQAVEPFLCKCSSSVECLLQRSADGRTLLMQMVLSAPLSTTKILLECNSEDHHLLAKDFKGKTALMLVSSEGNTEMVDLLLKSNSTLPHLMEKDKYGETALVAAIVNEHAPVVKCLLKANSDLQHLLAITRFTHETALMVSSRNGFKEVVQLLLDSNSNKQHLLAKNSDAQTALMIASNAGEKEIVELLLKSESDINNILEAQELAQSRYYFWSLLQQPERHRYFDVVKVLKRAARRCRRRYFFAQIANYFSVPKWRSIHS